MGLTRGAMQAAARGYGSAPVVTAVGSHSALDIADGAVAEGFRTLILAARGRERTYSEFFRATRDATGRAVRGCVDDVWTLDSFGAIAERSVIDRVTTARGLLVPNRALSSYLPLDVIEDTLPIPLIGSRSLLRIEERSERDNYYALLGRAGVRTPDAFAAPEAIDSLAIVKVPHATRRLERGFFTATSPAEYREKATALVASGTVRLDDLPAARIERYVIGPVFNFNFFRSPLETRANALELLGVDERRESSLDGLVRLPAAEQLEIGDAGRTPRYTVVGHGTLTVRESILEEVFRMGERFCEAARASHPPGVIGPFCLQTCVDADGIPWVFDVAVRIGGGTNIHLGVGHPYGNALWREPMSTGRRIAREIRTALATGQIGELVT